ncbi:tRNA guanosine(34) transglycosylase Tgt [Candidatus Parcubacteria bacterium]|nr:MAG: tRNA guanosine(34) transglycosylase Tgt [Candidatus Parcubacteria bacterium]
MSFLIKNKLGLARTGIIKTAHGNVETPNFAFVATHGFIKSLKEEDYFSLAPELTISNTFHLFVTGKHKEIKKAGGLHKMFPLKNPIMTDSGGFQVFSLGWGKKHNIGKVDKTAKNPACVQPVDKSTRPPARDVSKTTCVAGGVRACLPTGRLEKDRNPVKILSDRVIFTYDGKKFELTPRKSIKIQEDLGADIIFAFDECTSPLHDYEYNKKSLKKTHSWAKECLKAKKKNGQMLYGIVQGGIFENLRKESSSFIGALPFDGFGIGGSFGEKQMEEVIGWALSGLPENKPRHLLGIGAIKDIFIGVGKGIDTFDCVIPTREARHGAVYSMEGRLDIKRGVFEKDKKALDKGCGCFVCSSGIKRKDLRILFKENIPEAQRLATIHNIHFYKKLFGKIREAIDSGKRSNLKKLEKHYKF